MKSLVGRFGNHLVHALLQGMTGIFPSRCLEDIAEIIKAMMEINPEVSDQFSHFVDVDDRELKPIPSPKTKTANAGVDSILSRRSACQGLCCREAAVHSRRLPHLQVLRLLQDDQELRLDPKTAAIIINVNCSSVRKNVPEATWANSKREAFLGDFFIL